MGEITGKGEWEQHPIVRLGGAPVGPHAGVEQFDESADPGGKAGEEWIAVVSAAIASASAVSARASASRPDAKSTNAQHSSGATAQGISPACSISSRHSATAASATRLPDRGEDQRERQPR